MLDLLPDELFPFVEIPYDQDVRGLLAVLVGSDAGAKVRTGGVKLAFKPVREEIPIWYGAVLEKGLETCGEVADGWIPANLPVECINWGRGVIEQGAAKADRNAEGITIAPTFQLAVHEDVQQVMPLLKFG
ncbi:MAG: LLM class flavin-dependent oxidoreductase, partial [Planctomycetaceae bacterium]|nr:LLM class flavin-dependent oxidoreductase [Planctomycetaceae bacterium]